MAVAFAPDGATLAAGTYATVQWFDVATGKQRGRLRGQPGATLSVAFSPDGKALATGGADRAEGDYRSRGVARVWEVATGRERFALPAGGHGIWGVAFAP